MRRRLNPLWMIGLILGFALVYVGHGWVRQRALAAGIHARAERIDALQLRLSELDAQRTPLARDLESGQRRRSEAVARAGNLAGQLAGTGRARNWEDPPPSLPSWDSDSPFVWLPKDQLDEFPVRGFGDDGALLPDVAAVMTLEPEQVKTLNRNLIGIVTEYRALEVSRAHPVDRHLPGIAERDGQKLTIEIGPMGELADSFKERYESTLRSALGRQRSDLLMRTSESWLNEQFNPGGKEPKVFSVLRSENGTYNLTMKSGGSFMSVGGPTSIEDYIPMHLRSLFASILDSSGAGPKP